MKKNFFNQYIYNVLTTCLVFSTIYFLFYYTYVIAYVYFIIMAFIMPFSFFLALSSLNISNFLFIRKILIYLIKILIYTQIFEFVLKFFEFLTFRITNKNFKNFSVSIHVLVFGYYLYTRFIILNVSFNSFFYQGLGLYLFDFILIIAILAVIARICVSCTLVIINTFRILLTEGQNNDSSFNTNIHAGTLARVNNTYNNFHNLSPKGGAWKMCGLVFMGCTLAVGCYTANQIRMQNILTARSIMLNEVSQGITSREVYENKYKNNK